MKDSLILEDKIYISARRAAQMSGYATDYIGQLCRDGRVNSRMVGRAWFVEESAIKNYSGDNPKKQNRKESSVKNSVQSFPPNYPQNSPPVGLPIMATADGPVNAHTDSLGELIKKVLSEHNHAIIINQQSPQIPDPTLQLQAHLTPPEYSPPQQYPPPPPQYVIERERELERIRHYERERELEREHEREREKIREREREREKERVVERDRERERVRQKEIEKEFEPLKIREPAQPRSRSPQKFGLGSMVAIASLVFIIVSGIASLSLFYSTPVISQAQFTDSRSLNSAAVANTGPIATTLTALKFIVGSVYSGIAHAIYGSRPEPNPTLTTQPVDTAIAVAPATGDKDKDAVIRTTLQQSFSDEVKVTSDAQGGSGVIEPVFKKETKDSFIYVAVPIKPH